MRARLGYVMMLVVCFVIFSQGSSGTVAQTSQNFTSWNKAVFIGAKNDVMTFLVEFRNGTTEKLDFRKTKGTLVLDTDGREIARPRFEKESLWKLEVELESGQRIPTIRKMQKLREAPPR